MLKVRGIAGTTNIASNVSGRALGEKISNWLKIPRSKT